MDIITIGEKDLKIKRQEPSALLLSYKEGMFRIKLICFCDECEIRFEHTSFTHIYFQELSDVAVCPRCDKEFVTILRWRGPNVDAE